MKLYFKIFTLFFLSSLLVKAQSSRSYSCYDTVEISRTDITRIKEFNGLAATAFGLHLGQKLQEAQDSIKNFHPYNLFLEHDRYNNDRYYLYEVPVKEKRRLLAYCIWAHKDSGLKEIILFGSGVNCMPQGNAALFSCDGLDSTTTLFREFFGKPAYEKVETDVPSIHLKTTRYYYPQLALIIVVSETEEKTTYQLVLYNSGVYY